MNIRWDDEDGSLSRAMASFDEQEAAKWARMTRLQRAAWYIGAALTALLALAAWYAAFLILSVV